MSETSLQAQQEPKVDLPPSKIPESVRVCMIVPINMAFITVIITNMQNRYLLPKRDIAFTLFVFSENNINGKRK